MPKKYFFSIIIPTLNEEKYLPKLLGDLAKQSFQNFEVIHIDGDSEDKTTQVAKKFSSKMALKTTVVKKRNVALQRNTGKKKARGEWLLFMDADNRLQKKFLQLIHEQLLGNPRTDIFTCLIKLVGGKTLPKATEKFINNSLELVFLLGKPLAFGALIGCRSSLAKNVWFDETQKMYEDSRFVRDLVSEGGVFQLFKKPTYGYSARRMDKEGLTKMLWVGVITTLRFINGKDFSQKDFGYAMEGGNYYDQLPDLPSSKFKTLLANASQKQRSRAKKILQQLRDFRF